MEGKITSAYTLDYIASNNHNFRHSGNWIWVVQWSEFPGFCLSIIYQLEVFMSEFYQRIYVMDEMCSLTNFVIVKKVMENISTLNHSTNI